MDKRDNSTSLSQVINLLSDLVVFSSYNFDEFLKKLIKVAIEIVPVDALFFDFDAKYKPGGSREITPPQLPPDVITAIQKITLVAHRAIGACGMSRTDMILAPTGELFVLEINTIPGMTATSLLPQAAQAAGISFPQLLDHIIAAAQRRQLATSHEPLVY